MIEEDYKISLLDELLQEAESIRDGLTGDGFCDFHGELNEEKIEEILLSMPKVKARLVAILDIFEEIEEMFL